MLSQSNFIPNHNYGREKVYPEKAFLLSVWYLANQNSFREVADRFGLSYSATHNCLKRTLEFLISLTPNTIKWPMEEAREEIKEAFSKNNGPKAMGAIDGTHFEILKPSENQDSYINRKGYHSILLQGVVDHKKRFIDVFAGEPGSLHDARLLRKSRLYSKIMEDPTFIGNDFLLGDSAYPNLSWLVTPFKDHGLLTQTQKMFNYRLSSKRVIIENAFGLLKGRFRRLKSFENLSLHLCSKLILSACVLHNICINDVENNLIIDENDLNQPQDEHFNRNIPIEEFNNRQLQVFNEMFNNQ